MSESLGTAVLTLDADGGPLDDVLTATESGVLGRFRSMAGSTKNLIGVAIGAVAGLAVAGGKMLYDIGEQFDDAYDKIQTGTGATGRALEGLKDDFRDVVKSVPTDFDSASTAITELHRRLGVTGEPLRALSKQVLELSRITGTDLQENIESVSRLFGDWGIETDDQAATLDKLYRVSQETGIGVSELSRYMVQFGSPLRQLGLDFDTSAAMFAKFEKEGVNIQTLMPGLRMALKNFSEAGVDPAKGLRDTFDAIENAASSAEANQLAFETFGARAGPDMAAAIREGRFELGDLIDTMENGKGTIRDSGRDTMDLTEQWQLFKNRGMLLLEPVAVRVFAALGDGMKWLNKNWPAIVANVNAATDWLKKAWEDIEPAVRFVVQQVGNQLSDFKNGFKGAFEIVKGLVDVFVGAIHGDFGQMWDGLKSLFKGGVDMILGIFKTLTGPARRIAGDVARVILDGISKIGEVPGKLADYFSRGLGRVEDFIPRFLQKAVSLGKNIVKGIGDGLADFVSKIADFMSRGADRVISFADNFLQKATSLGKNAVRGIGDGLADFVSKIAEKISGGVDRLAGYADQFFNTAVKLGKEIVSGIGNAISDVGSVISNAMKKALGAVADVAASVGRSIANWINDNTIMGDRVEIDIGPKTFGFTIPALATGARNFMGGWAWVGEEGPELVNLPGGSDVFTASESRSMSQAGGSVDHRTYIAEVDLGDGVKRVVDLKFQERDRAKSLAWRAEGVRA